MTPADELPDWWLELGARTEAQLAAPDPDYDPDRPVTDVTLHGDLL